MTASPEVLLANALADVLHQHGHRLFAEIIRAVAPMVAVTTRTDAAQQAQGGGEVVAVTRHDAGFEPGPLFDPNGWDRLRSLPKGTKLYTAPPPSAPAPVAGDAVAKLVKAARKVEKAIQTGGHFEVAEARTEMLHRCETVEAALAQDRASQAAAPSAPETEENVAADSYHYLTELLEPYVAREGSNPNGPFPASVVESFQMLLEHWKATQAPSAPVLDDPEGSLRWLDRRIADMGDEDKTTELYQHYVNLRSLIRPSAPVGVIGDAIQHLSKWLDLNECECETSHQCGRAEVERTRDQLRALAQQPAAVDEDVRELLDAMDGGTDPRPAFMRLRRRFPPPAGQQQGGDPA